MNDVPETGPKVRSFKLDFDILVGGEIKHPAGTEIVVRKPHSGELRGLKVSELLNSDYVSLEALAPRITSPILHRPLFAALDPADLTQFAGEVMDFLLPKSMRQDSPTA